MGLPPGPDAAPTTDATAERLHHAIEGAGVGTVLLDGQGRITYANPAGVSLLNTSRLTASPDGLVGRSLSEFFHTDDRHLVAVPPVARDPGEHKALPTEVRLALAGPLPRWVSVHLSSLDTDATGRAWLVQFEDVTIRRKLARTLAQSEVTARSALDALEQGVILATGDGTIHLLNPAAERLLGFSALELSQQWQSGLWKTFDEHGVELPFDARPIFQARTSRKPVIGQLVGWKRSDGATTLLRVSCVPDADGAEGFVVAFTDVTAEHRMTLDLRRFSHLFQHANDVITIIDTTGTVMYSSPSARRVLGYPEGHEYPNGILGLVHPDDLAHATKELRALIANTRTDEAFNVRVLANSGEWRHLETMGVNLLDEPAVGGIVLTSRDITDRQRLTEQLVHRAAHDDLTDLPNRRALSTRLEHALATAQSERRHIAVCFIDLDGFKQVNDTFGHAAGDHLLIDVAEGIRNNLRHTDLAARFGGDEFVVVLDPVHSRADASSIAARLHAAISRHDARWQPGVEFGVSIGLAVSEADDTPSTLLKRADTALYRAKTHNRSSVQLAEAAAAEVGRVSSPGRD